MTTKPEENRMRKINTQPKTLDEYFTNQKIIFEDYDTEIKRLHREIELVEQYKNRAVMCNKLNAGKNDVFQVRFGDFLRHLAKEYQIQPSDIQVTINTSKKMTPDQQLGEERMFVSESDACMEIFMTCTNPSKTFNFVERIPLMLNMKLSDGSILIDHLTKTNRTLFATDSMGNNWYELEFDKSQTENLLLHFPPQEGNMFYGKFERAVIETIREKERNQNLAKQEERTK